MKKHIIIFLCIVCLAFCANDICHAQKAETYYYKASKSLTNGNMAEAVSFYKLATEKNNKFFEAYLGLSIAYREQGQYEKAHEAVLKVIELKPDYYQVYYNLGLILEKQNKLSEAVDVYQKFLDKVPGAARYTDTKQRISRIKASR